jgi:hypothetical protein
VLNCFRSGFRPRPVRVDKQHRKPYRA